MSLPFGPQTSGGRAPVGSGGSATPPALASCDSRSSHLWTSGSPGSTPTVLTKTASFYTDGSDGIIQYTTINGDLDTAGEWGVQAYIVSASGTWHSDIIPMRVYPNVS